MFCDLLLQQRSLDNLAYAIPKSVDRPESLLSHDALLAHELLHCRIVGIKGSVGYRESIVPGLSDRQRMYSIAPSVTIGLEYTAKAGSINAGNALMPISTPGFMVSKHWKWVESIGHDRDEISKDDRLCF